MCTPITEGFMGKVLNFETKFKIKAKSETEAEIIIYDAIGSSWWEDTVSAKDFSKELSALPSTTSQINVRINSPGGDVFDGQTIYNRLKQHSANITVYVDGIAASIASIIAMAGDEIIMSEGAQIMIHKPMTGIWGNATEMQETIDLLDGIEEQMLGIYNRRTGIDKNELRSMLQRETWMDADEAIELGFADRAMAEGEGIRAVACDISGAKWIKKPHMMKVPTQAENVKENIDGMLSGLQEFLDNK